MSNVFCYEHEHDYPDDYICKGCTWAGDRTSFVGPHVKTINGAPQCGQQVSKGILHKYSFSHRKSHFELFRMLRMFKMVQNVS